MEQIKLPGGETLFQGASSQRLTGDGAAKRQFLRTFGILSVHYGSLDSKFELREGGRLRFRRA